MAAPYLPQRAVPANAEVVSVEWLFEPHWNGDRIIARIEGDKAILTDAAGQPAGPETAPTLSAGVSAGSAVIDGVWVPRALGDGDNGAFVAFDLLELDGEDLTVLPFQDRRRLLESIIVASDDVRLSPVVKHPVARWLDAWRANGFSHYLAKHQNSRYLAGEENEQWLDLSLAPDAPAGILAGMFGRRDHTRRIRD
jgi:bifunctional non-homologous end joining protein LigD